MKKKLMMIGAGLTVGSALVITSAFAGVGVSQGYEAYKDALKATAGVTNATQLVNVTLTDNGAELLQVNAKVKDDASSGRSSGSIAIRTASQPEADTLDFYEQDGQTVLKSSDRDTYQLIEVSGDDEREGRYRHDFDANEARDLSEGAERVIDALVGNLKNNFVLVQEADGGKTVNLELSGAQIPAAANAIGSLLVKEALNSEHEAPEPEQFQDVQNLFGIDLQQLASSMPKLTDDVNIDRVGMSAEVGPNDELDRHEVSFTISGKDAAGKVHTVVLETDIEVTERGETKPDTVDLSGVKTETIDLGQFE